jgi:hypothetical protein
VVSKKRFTVFEQTMRIPVRTVDGSHRGMTFEAFFAKEFMPKRKVRPAALRRLGDDGQVSVARVEGSTAFARTKPQGMKTIQHIKTMAGSPDADFASRSASRNLAHGFVRWPFVPFEKP